MPSVTSPELYVTVAGTFTMADTVDLPVTNARVVTPHGTTNEGVAADDGVIIDLDKSAVVDDSFYHTMEPGYSTFHGEQLTERPRHTIIDGEVVVEDGELLTEPGNRSYLPRGPEGVDLA